MMPIEPWPWIGQLAKTGFLALWVIGIPGLLLDAVKPGKILPAIMMILSVVPFAICACALLVLNLVNILILIWR